MLNNFIPIITGIYLFCALSNINKSLRNTNDAQVNVKAMALHATSFGLYMASTFILVIVYFMYAQLNIVEYSTFRICLAITFIFSALSQIVLSIIFWELGKKPEAPR